MIFKFIAITLIWAFPFFFILVLLWSRDHYLKALEKAKKEFLNKQAELINFLQGLREPFSEESTREDLYRYICEEVLQVVEGNGAALYLYQQEKELLHPVHLTSQLPPLITIPKMMSSRTFSSESSHQYRKYQEKIKNFLKLYDISIGDGLVGKAAQKPFEVELVRRQELDPILIDQGLYEVLLSPLHYQGQLLGVFIIGNGIDRYFTQEDHDLFEALVQEVAFGLYHETVSTEMNQKRVLDHDLALASEVQQLLLPKKLPSYAGYQIAALNLPATSLSGDYYDFLPLEGQKLGCVIADVSGKGLPAALMMATCRSVLRHQATLSKTSPLHVISRLNQKLYPDMKEDMFISMLYLILDQPTGEITLARAGHEPALLYKAKYGNVEIIQPKGMALGVDSGEVFDRFCTNACFVLESGDSLFLYTDGATQTFNQEGEPFGIDRFIAFLETHASMEPTSLLKQLREDIRAFAGYQSQQDDITLLAIHKI